MSQAAASVRRSKPHSKLRKLLDQTEDFVRFVELANSRGPLTAKGAQRVQRLATELASSGTADVLSLTDNSGGHPHLAPEALAERLRGSGQELLIHLSCKDNNRNGLASRAWALASAGLENILALSGDYPAPGFRGSGRPVFDLDSVGLLEMLEQMNRGWGAPLGGRALAAALPATPFTIGAVVSPYKRLESELLPQYFKLERKLVSGARFIITQAGFDARKLDDLIRWLARRRLHPPLIAGVYLLSAPVARHFHQGKVPGVVVTDRLLELVERQAAAADKGRAFFRELAAKQIAIARGLGYRGAYLSGCQRAEEIEQIFRQAEAFRHGWRDWVRELLFAQPNEFYFFGSDPATGLGSSRAAPAARRAGAAAAPWFRLHRELHRRFFQAGSIGYRVGRVLYTRIDRHPALQRCLHVLEQAIKIPLYGCRDCGDCSLAEVAYLCPESQCAKNQRNGPCGGSRDGRCEISARECIWARAYRRLQAVGEESTLLQRPTVWVDPGLRGSSAWANRFLERDHLAPVPNREAPMG